jgi:hypothetical protein
MGSPRVDVLFRLWQCDKENHDCREGPPVTRLISCRHPNRDQTAAKHFLQLAL